MIDICEEERIEYEHLEDALSYATELFISKSYNRLKILNFYMYVEKSQMNIIKGVIGLFAAIGLLGVVIFGDIISAIILLVFSCMSMGIMIGERKKFSGKK